MPAARLPEDLKVADSPSPPRWKNYTDSFTNVTADDLVIKMRRAFRALQFKPLVKLNPEPGEAVRTELG